MSMTPYILKATQWLLAQSAGKIFTMVTDDLAVKMGIKPEPLPGRRTRLLLEEYLQRLEDRLAKRVIARLDEDRLIKLKSGIVQLKRSSSTTAQRESLVNALNNFSYIISLPEQGETGGFPNAQLRSIAFLGIAAVHVALRDPKRVIAENIAAAVYADAATAEQWLGKDIVRGLLQAASASLSAGPVPTETITHDEDVPLLTRFSEATFKEMVFKRERVWARDHEPLTIITTLFRDGTVTNREVRTGHSYNGTWKTEKEFLIVTLDSSKEGAYQHRIRPGRPDQQWKAILYLKRPGSETFIKISDCYYLWSLQQITQ